MQNESSASCRGFILFLSLCLIAALLLCTSLYLSFVNQGYLEVAFIDVGQGDAALLHTPDHQRILIDGGEPSAGEYDLLPYLKTRGIHTLDAAIVTHCHDDHYGGILTLLKSENFTVETLYLHASVPHNDGAAELFEAAKEKDIEIKVLSAGDSLTYDAVKLQVISPTAEQLESAALNNKSNSGESVEENEASLVMKLIYGEASFLFTGDCAGTITTDLAARTDISADVLKSAHHGSADANRLEFLQAVQPQYAVISVEADNQYRLPSELTLSALSAIGVEPLRTDLDGVIVFTATEKGIQKIETGRKRK